jgi:hypothetical protein
MSRVRKNSKKTTRTMEYLSMVTVVGEELTSQAILSRMRNTPIPTKLGYIPDGWIPATGGSLGMKLRGNKNWQMIPLNPSGSKNVWRRVE